jgi:hypothetical protein
MICLIFCLKKWRQVLTMALTLIRGIVRKAQIVQICETSYKDDHLDVEFNA